MKRTTRVILAFAVMTIAFEAFALPVSAQSKQPNILVIFGDDVGYFNVSAYNHGMMGYRTPNIDRLAKQGAIFTDHYGQQSCTAGRAAFITGQSPIRTGLTKGTSTTSSRRKNRRMSTIRRIPLLQPSSDRVAC